MSFNFLENCGSWIDNLTQAWKLTETDTRRLVAYYNWIALLVMSSYTDLV